MPRPTRSLKDVQHAVGERVKELPVHAARLTVTGIGHMLLLTDRLREEAEQVRKSRFGPALGRLRDDAGRLVGRVADRLTGPPSTPMPPAGKPPVEPAGTETAESETAAGTAVETETAATATAEPDTGTAGAAKAEDESAAAKPAEPAEPARPAEPGEPAEPAVVEAAAHVPDAASLPIPDYDQRTIPSLRSRLRGLSVEQVTLLRDYENGHRQRAEVLRMYGNRIAKLKDDGKA